MATASRARNSVGMGLLLLAAAWLAPSRPAHASPEDAAPPAPSEKPLPAAPAKPYKAAFPTDLAFDPKEWTTVTDYEALGDPRAKRVPGRALTLWWGAFPATLRTDGPNSNTTEVSDLHGLVYESMIDVHPETEEFIPLLASHWTIRNNADETQTFTFRLDERARWADGAPVQADDVYWSWWHRVQEDRNDPSNIITFKENYKEPEVLDRLTIRVTTRKMNWRLFLYFGGMAIYPAREVAIPGEEYLEAYNWRLPVGSGPYVLNPEDLKKGESVTLTRRNDWWAENEPWARNTNNFDRLKYVVVRETELAYEMFKKGELDWFQVGQARRWIEDVPKERIVQKGWVQRRKIYNKRPVGFAGLCFNMRQPPFDDRRVRLAFAHLFNREELMARLFFDEYEFTNSTYPSSEWGTGEERPRVEYDQGLALELLSEAGYQKRDADGFLLGPDGKRLEVTLEYGAQEWERIWIVVQEYYQKAGVKFHLKLLDPSTLLKKVSERQFTIHFQSWRAILFPNPETSWHSSLADQLYNNNVPGFKSARVDELCDAYDRALDRPTQRKIIREIDEIICDEHPYAFGWHARSDRVLYWDRFGHPEKYVSRIGTEFEGSLISYWWFDLEREKALEAARAKDQDLPQGTLEIKPWG